MSLERLYANVTLDYGRKKVVLVIPRTLRPVAQHDERDLESDSPIEPFETFVASSEIGVYNEEFNTRKYIAPILGAP